MQRQSVRQQNLTEILQETSHYPSNSASQAQNLQSSNQFQAKQSQSSKTVQQSSKSQLKQNEQNSQKMNQNRQRSSDDDNHLHLLHAKLNSETDRILKWKVSTELEISQKEKKLKETEEVMERQRKNLFELQMNSEQLSHRLQIELKNREELASKIDNTRKICNIVRDHCNQLTSTLNLCVEEKESLKIVYSDQIKEIEDLSDKFSSIETEFKTEIEQLEEMVTEERKERNKIINEANAMHTILNDKLEFMDKKIHIESEKASSLDEQLVQSLEKIKILKNENSEINAELTQSKSQFNDLENQMSVERKKFEKDLTEISLLVKEEKLRLDTIKKQYAEAMDNILEMEKVKANIVSENESLTETLKNYKCLNEKNIEEIKKIYDEYAAILKERNELIQEVKSLKELQVTLQTMEEDNKIFVEENHSIRKELGDAHEKILVLENNIKSSEDMALKYQKEKENIEEKVCSLEETIKILNEKISKAQNLENEMKQKIESLNEELRNERNQVQCLQSKLELDTSELTAILEKSQSDSAMKEMEMKTLQQESVKTKLLISNLHDQQEAHLEQIRNLEEERDSVKKSLSSEMEKTESLNDKVKYACELNEKLKKDLENLQSEMNINSEMKKNLIDEKKSLGEKLDQLNKELLKVSEEKNDYQAKYSKAEKEKQAIQAKSDSEIKEMVAVLEKYKRECDEIVNQKEARISSLLSDIGDMQNEKGNLDETITIFKKENYTYQRKIMDLEKEKEITEKTFQVKMMDLELQLTSKDKEIAERDVALLKSDSNMSPHKRCNTPSKIKSPRVDERKLCPQTPKINMSPAPTKLNRTPIQLGGILKESNTPGGNKKQVTFQEDTSDTDASSVDAMILDNNDLLTRFEALERGVKMMTPIRVHPSPKCRRKSEHRKMEMHLKDLDNSSDFMIKKARLNKQEDFDEVKKNKSRDNSGLKQFLRPKMPYKDCGRNSGLDLDEMFEMVED